MGLVNRVVPDRHRARRTRWPGAAELAALPQVCLRNDRRSTLAQWGLSGRGRHGRRDPPRARQPGLPERPDGAARFSPAGRRVGAATDRRAPRPPTAEPEPPTCPTSPPSTSTAP